MTTPADVDPGLEIPRLEAFPEEWPTLGVLAREWIECYLCHGPGDVQGDGIVLDVEFATFLQWAYRLRPDGRRQYRHALLSRPKGRAKSELAAMVSCFELIGPCRFDGWGADGTPRSRPIRAPFIRNMATETTQTGNTYEGVRVMLEHALDVAGDEFPGLDPGLTRTFGPDGGTLVPSTASASSKDGGKETFAVADETHLWYTPELKRTYDTVSRNLTKRRAADPWLLETSTMYGIGQQSIAEATYRQAARVAAGVLKSRSILVDHRQCGELDWDDDEQVLAGLRDVYGFAAEHMDFDAILDKIRDPQSRLVESVRYFGNRAAPTTGAAFDVGGFRQLANTERVVKRNEWVTLGFDGARFHDATALVGCCVTDAHLFTLGIWERPEHAGDDWEVPVAEVDAVVADAFDRFKVLRFHCDPPYWEEQVDGWAGRWGDRKVFRWWTHRPRPMAFAVRAFASAIKGNALSHDGDPLLCAHVANARVHETLMKDDTGRALFTIRKEHASSPNKIDAAMAAILAFEARGDAIADGALRRQHAKAAGF